MRPNSCRRNSHSKVGRRFCIDGGSEGSTKSKIPHSPSETQTIAIKTIVLPNEQRNDHDSLTKSKIISHYFGQEEISFPSIECVIVDKEYDENINYIEDSTIPNYSSAKIQATFASKENESANIGKNRKIPFNSFHDNSNIKKAASPHCIHCKKYMYSPTLPPEKWPQHPLLLRPTPGSNTRVIGIRFASEPNNYLETPWPEALRNHWRKNEKDELKTMKMKKNVEEDGFKCPYCQIIPINNGNEKIGESLVTDFESDLFKGTLLIRIKNSKGTTKERHLDDQDNPNDLLKTSYQNFFHGVHRSYQVVIQGHFKTHKDNENKCVRQVPILECVTGQAGFQKPSAYLPPRFIRNAAIRILSIFAPRLQTKFDGLPKFLSPLSSTPQVVILKNRNLRIGEDCNEDNQSNKNTINIEDDLEEPSISSYSLLSSIIVNDKDQSGLYVPSKSPLSINRARHRKKIFDKLHDSKSICPMFVCYSEEDDFDDYDENMVEYTFEFLQHLVNFKQFNIDLGNLGKLRLSRMLDGQPLKIMAAHQDSDEKGLQILKWIWSFDIWHESLYEASLRHERNNETK